jgi:uncharacterized cupredoxin-like copper-binding protein
MPRLRTSIPLIVIAALATACAGTAAAPSPQTSAAAASTPSPTAAAIASTAPAPAAAAIAPTVALTEWSVTVAGTVKAGKMSITATNTGVAQHELLIFKSDLAASAYPINKAGNIIEEGAGVSLVSDGENIDPAGSQVRSINLTPGKYLFLCNIAGHFKAGMFTVVTVTG